MTCTPLDHSDYKPGTNHYGLERRSQELTHCAKCGRPDFMQWWRSIDWKSRDKSYWKQIFREGEEEQVFFFKSQPKNSWGSYYVSVDPDVSDVASVLRPERPRWYLGKDVVNEIRQRRYQERRQGPKSHDYGWRQPFIDAALRGMCEDLNDGCIDNRRYAALDNRKDMKRYREQADSGCCGRHDEVVSVFGRKFMIGCNYGH